MSMYYSTAQALQSRWGTLEDSLEDAARLCIEPCVVLISRAVEGQGPAFFINHHELRSNAYSIITPI